jgi:hypothetical protein
MPKKKILFAGCSFTANCGFTDENRLMYHWPELFSKHFDVYYQNVAVGGCSNNEIFKRTIESTADQLFDLVIVMWSSTDRKWVYYSDNNIDDFTNVTGGMLCGFNSHLAESNTYSKLHYTYFNNQYINLKHWLIDSLALAKYFEAIQQPYIFLKGFSNLINDVDCITYRRDLGFANISNTVKKFIDFDNRPDYYINEKIKILQNLISQNKKLNWFDFLSNGFSELTVDVSDDNMHPGIRSNQIFATRLINHCQEQQLL